MCGLKWGFKKRKKKKMEDNGDNEKAKHMPRQQARWDNLFLSCRRHSIEIDLEDCIGTKVTERRMAGMNLFRYGATLNIDGLIPILKNRFVERSVEEFINQKKDEDLKPGEFLHFDEIYKITLLSAIKKYLIEDLYELLLETKDGVLGYFLSRVYASVQGCTDNFDYVVNESGGNFGRTVWVHICIECEHLAKYKEVVRDSRDMISEFQKTDEMDAIMRELEDKIVEAAEKLNFPKKEFMDFVFRVSRNRLIDNNKKNMS